VLFFKINAPQKMTDVPILQDDEIAENLEMVPSRTPDPDRSADLFEKGKLLYGRHRTSRAHLSEIIAAYKEAIAYSGEEHIDDDTHNEIYRMCLAALTRAVQQEYRKACVLERDRNWNAANIAFANLLRLIGDKDNPICRNIQSHLKRIHYYKNKDKPKQPGLFG